MAPSFGKMPTGSSGLMEWIFWPLNFREAHEGLHIDLPSSIKAVSFGTL